MQRMSGTDGMFIHMETPKNYWHTLKISIIDPSQSDTPWSWETLRDLIERHMHRLPLLRKRHVEVPFDLDHPLWVDDPDFDLDYHLHRVAIPSPGDERAFCQLVSKLYSRPLDFDRPLWQAWVVEGLPGGKVAIVNLLHHSYTDGVGAIKLMAEYFSTSPTDDLPEIEPWSPEPFPTKQALVLHALRDLPGRMTKELPAAMKAIYKKRHYEKQQEERNDNSVPQPGRHVLHEPYRRRVSSNRTFASRTLDFPHFKAISKALKVTVNDLFVACVASAVQDDLRHRGITLDEPTLSCMAFNLKPLDERVTPGNHVATDYHWLHANELDPLERLKLTKQSNQATREHFKETSDANMIALMDLVPGWLGKALGKLNHYKVGGVLPMRNIAVSNVPGPRKTIYLGKWPVSDWISTGGIVDGVTINFTMWTYVNNLALCLTADQVLFPDPWRIIDSFEAHLEEYGRIATEQFGASLPPKTVRNGTDD